MVSQVGEARRAAVAGADIVVAQGMAGGGHVGVMGTMALAPQGHPGGAGPRLSEAGDPGTVLEVEREREGGKVVYEVEIRRADGRVYEVVLEASTGVALEGPASAGLLSVCFARGRGGGVDDSTGAAL
jgi:hypothetical protein